jgi:Double zinc ribbon
VSGDLIALIAGTVLAVAALAFVLYPLFFAVRPRVSRPATASAARAADDSAIVALREIEFDKATGKLSEADYTELKRTYSERALLEMRRAGSLGPEATSDPIEARVRAFRAHRECDTCGVRPEADAIYCSNCGAFLDRACPECGAEISEAGAAFCTRCGVSLSQPALTSG